MRVIYSEQGDASTDRLTLARTLFDLKEFIKAASVLTEFASPNYPETHFLYNYSMYMFGEYRKEEESLED
jgi:hypothetical protein